MHVERLVHNPIIRPEMLQGDDGENINGPSLIRTPEWLPDRMGTYYLYFAHHSGSYIRLAYADALDGPWTVHEPGTLRLDQVPVSKRHIASPDVHVDAERREIRMYFHGDGPVVDGRLQHTFVARSKDGLDFDASDEILGNAYWRAFQLDAHWYAMGRRGHLYRSRDGLTEFEAGPNPFPQIAVTTKIVNRLRRRGSYPTPSRHVAVELADDDGLWIYFSDIGDAPERIRRVRCSTHGDWRRWRAGHPEEVLRPEIDWEGAHEPVRPSIEGASLGAEHALRDPAFFADGDRRFLLYSVAGESGIAIAELHG
jgi:hypothetical protein